MWFFVSPSLLLRTVPDPSAAHVSRKKGRSRLIGMETPVGSLISGTPDLPEEGTLANIKPLSETSGRVAHGERGENSQHSRL